MNKKWYNFLIWLPFLILYIVVIIYFYLAERTIYALWLIIGFIFMCFVYKWSDFWTRKKMESEIKIERNKNI